MDSLKGLAAMKSLAASKDDTPEGEEERDKVGICGAVLCLPFAIAMVIVGSQYWPGPCYGDAALWLVVAGAISMADASLKIYARFTKTKVDDAVVKKASPGLSLGFFCVVIWGSIQVFGSHSDVCFALKDAVGDDLEYQCTDDTKYCPEVPFNFAFGILIVQWIMLPFTCCCGMMSCMFSMCKQTSQSANVETAWKN